MTSDRINTSQRNRIRHTLRQKRRTFPPSCQHRSAINLADIILHHPALIRAQHIGFFLSFDGEINTSLAIDALWKKEKQIYLPKIHPFNPTQLLFLKYSPESSLEKGKFNILTPKLDVRSALATHQLDILFVPLVAFDRRGYRLGMGGGFYDRTLAAYPKTPFVPIGLAYSFQEVNHIPEAPWDVPLSEIITEKEHIHCANSF